MLPEKYMSDWEQLREIAKEQNGSLNLSLIMITLKPQEEDLQAVLDYLRGEDIEILNNDVEPDSIGPSSSINPFDPSKIDIRMDKLSVDSLIKRIKNKEIAFDSDFQRKAGLWKKTQKSQLIESILLKIPLPAFYFDASDDDKWIIIDGLQRVTTLKEYVVERSFALEGMEFLTLNGLTFDRLPRSLQRRIEETNINAYLVNPATPTNVKYNIFKRINTGGLTLESQEIRNALYQGHATRFLKDLASYPVFSQATDNSVKEERMLDREFCLRFVAFACRSLENYNGVTDDFLNDSMDYLNRISEHERNKIKEKFEIAMRRCYLVFGKFAFRKMASDGRRRPINKALFEGWTYVISQLNDVQFDHILNNKSLLKINFTNLCETESFIAALKATDKNSIMSRIQMIRNLALNMLTEEGSHA